MTLKFFEVKWVAKGHSQKSELARASVFQEVGRRGNQPIFSRFSSAPQAKIFSRFRLIFGVQAVFPRESPPLSLALRLFNHLVPANSANSAKSGNSTDSANSANY